MSRLGGSEIGGAKFRLSVDDTELKQGFDSAKQTAAQGSDQIAQSNDNIAKSFRKSVAAVTGFVSSVTAAVGVATSFFVIGSKIASAFASASEKVDTFADSIATLSAVGQIDAIDKKLDELYAKRARLSETGVGAAAGSVVNAILGDTPESIKGQIDELLEKRRNLSGPIGGKRQRSILDDEKKKAEELQKGLDALARTFFDSTLYPTTFAEMQRAGQMLAFEAQQAKKIADQRRESEEETLRLMREQTRELQRQQQIFEDLQRRQLGSGLAGLGSFGPLVRAIENLNTNMQGRGR